MIRIISRLDVKGANLIKSVQMEGLRVLGNPVDFAEHYYHNGADAILYVDFVASLYQRSCQVDLIRKIGETLFIPFTVCGGIRTIEDVQKILRNGAEKIGFNTAAIENPHLIREVAHCFGSQCVVLSVEARRNSKGEYECLTNGGRETTGRSVLDWVRQGVELGAGEILLTSVDREGCGKGFDIELIQKVCELVNVPVIASGGAGSVEDVLQVFTQTKADGVAIASLFHYYQSDATRSSFAGKNEWRCIQPTTINVLKNFLMDHGIACRHSA